MNIEEKINDLIEDNNEFILTINKEEIESKRIKIFKKGVGEVGSLSIDEITTYLNNEIKKNNFSAGEYARFSSRYFETARQHTI